MQKTYTNFTLPLPSQKIQKGKHRDLPGYRLLAAPYPFVGLSFSPSPCPLSPCPHLPLLSLPTFPTGKCRQIDGRDDAPRCYGPRRATTSHPKKSKKGSAGGETADARVF